MSHTMYTCITASKNHIFDKFNYMPYIWEFNLSI